jgi:hypothetical protein
MTLEFVFICFIWFTELTFITSLNCVNQLIFVTVKYFPCGTDWILKYYLDVIRIQSVHHSFFKFLFLSVLCCFYLFQLNTHFTYMEPKLNRATVEDTYNSYSASQISRYIELLPTAWNTRCRLLVWSSAVCLELWWCGRMNSCRCRNMCQDAKFSPASWYLDSSSWSVRGNWALSLSSTVESSSPLSSPTDKATTSTWYSVPR